ncbi:DUF2207 domain-containing protein [Iamia sp. SCSIO 61187]|uniref:DUF2207 domain-containing protein n=1 Tax=Iamia sp. SCSIO 61187 TaxID=2722752 RepID=UPI001C62C109|nr:DUF2207 domain-containing protein [Iamia sp. SCSIO 61187]QYG92324.1 DUF2207 domain-containing protein [Iamia sp. SCSIO 61187]
MPLRMGLRHLAVVASVLVVAALVGLGIVGPVIGTERITGFQVVAAVQDDGSVRVREVIDWDFGVLAVDKHGIFREIPLGAGGRPADVEVSSPDAPADVQTTIEGASLRIRIGDADQTVRGRHRYEIRYTLPSVVRDDFVALNLIGPEWDVPIDGVDARIVGADLSDVECFRGRERSRDRCAVAEVDGGVRTTADHLDPHEGITVQGRVGARTEATLPELAPMAERDGSAGLRWAALVTVVGLLVGLATYLVCRRVGRNQVAAGGATEAAFAYGNETFGTTHDVDDSPPGTRMVANEKMGELAGVEFVPPGGVEPWQGAAVLREAIDDRTVGAWFSSLAAHDIVSFGGDEQGALRLGPGPAAATADPIAAPILNRALAGRPGIDLGGYDPAFAGAWKEAGTAVESWVRTSGVFRRRPPRRSSLVGGARLGLVLGVGLGVGIPLVVGLYFLGRAVGVLGVPIALFLAVVVPLAVGLAVYWRLVRSLSWRGSAIALRTEAFRRFLHDSEAQHVEWAWQHGLLREYSAWAVALGEARAWKDALARSAVPPVEQDGASSVMVPAVYASSVSATHTAPSSSGGDGGGGSVGGGDGGGGGGSW